MKTEPEGSDPERESGQKAHNTAICLLCLKQYSVQDSTASGDDKHTSLVGPYKPRLISPTCGLGFTPPPLSSSSPKEVGGDIPSSDTCDIDIYTRFLHLTSRYLRLATSTELFLKGAKEHKSANNGVPVHAFCTSCRILAGYLCDLYAELQAVKLRLIDTLGRVKEVMTVGRNKINWKVYRVVATTLKDQLNVHSQARVLMFRKLFLNKCAAKEKDCVPKPLVPRGLFPEHWKVGYPACKLMMMRLIVVFLLASKSVHGGQQLEEDAAVTIGNAPKINETKKIAPGKARRSRGRPKRPIVASKEQEITPKKIAKDADANAEKMVNVKTESNDAINDVAENIADFDVHTNDNDSDWSRGAASPASPMASPPGSDTETQPVKMELESEQDPPPQTRWNLRRRNRKPTVKFAESSDSDSDVAKDNDEDENDKDFEVEMDAAEKDGENPEPQDPDKPKKWTLRTKMKYNPNSRRGCPKIKGAEPTVPCPKCARLFLDRRSLSSHYLHVHNANLGYSCVTCGQKFRIWKELRSHKRSVHRKMQRPKSWSRKPRKCTICLDLFSTLEELAEHRRENHKGETAPHLPRKRKGYQSGSESEEEEEDGEEEEESPKRGKYSNGIEAKCRKCGEVFPSGNKLRQHLSRDPSCGGRSRGEFKCRDCEQVFSFKTQMMVHMRKEHPSGLSGGRPPVGEAKCTKCGEVFPSGKEMVAHRRKAHLPNRYYSARPCDDCDRKFYTRRALRNHQRAVHYIIQNSDEEQPARIYHDCHICNRKFCGDGRFESHLQSHADNTFNVEESHFCEVCGQRLETELLLTAHMTQVHNDLYSCLLCKTDVLSGKLLRDHLVSHEKPEKYFHCMACFRGFSSQQYYDIHRSLHQSSGLHLCDHDQCNESFEKLEDLNDHLQGHVEEGVEVHLCKDCGKGFIKKYNFTLHELSHTPKNEAGGEGQSEAEGYACPAEGCGQVVKFLATLMTHYNRAHGEGLMPYKCYLCSKTFSLSGKYRRHVRECTDEEGAEGPRFCKLCGEHFGDKTSFVEHRVQRHPNKRKVIMCPEPGCEVIKPPQKMNAHLVRVHGKGERYPCEQCGKTFSSVERVKDHKRVHEPARYPCDQCEKRFKKPCFLRVHKERVHAVNREKAFTCHLCGMSYYSDVGLQYHYWGKHTDNKDLKWRCDKCGKGYGRKTLLTLHRKSCTGSQEEGMGNVDGGSVGTGEGDEKPDFKVTTVGNLPSTGPESHHPPSPTTAGGTELLAYHQQWNLD